MTSGGSDGYGARPEAGTMAGAGRSGGERPERSSEQRHDREQAERRQDARDERAEQPHRHAAGVLLGTASAVDPQLAR